MSTEEIKDEVETTDEAFEEQESEETVATTIEDEEDVDSEDSLTFSNGVIEKIVAIAVRELPQGLEVLPGHEYRFRGLAERIAQIKAHTDQRSAEVRQVVSGQSPHTVWDVAQVLTWSRGWDSLRGYTLRLALAETASHLVYLESLGLPVGIPGLTVD